jgi:hypothetical protein
MSIDLKSYQERASRISNELNNIKDPKNETDTISKIYLDTFYLCKEVDQKLVQLNDNQFTKILPEVEKLFALFQRVESIAKQVNVFIQEIEAEQTASKGIYYNSLKQQAPATSKSIHTSAEYKKELAPPLGSRQTLQEYKAVLVNSGNTQFKETNLTNKIDQLAEKGFLGVVPVGKDGNCFYRAVYVQHLFNVIKQQFVTKDFIESIDNLTGDALLNEAKVMVLEHLRSPPSFNTADELNVWVNQHPTMDLAYIRVFRQLASQYLQTHLKDQIAGASIEDLIGDVNSYIEQINKMGSEAEGLVLHMLPLALGIKLNIVTLFTGDKNSNLLQTYGTEFEKSSIDILFRPGHYDILIRSPIIELEEP